MKIIFRILIINLLLFAGNSIFSQTQSIDEAVFEKISKTFILNEDGSQEFHYYKKIRFNTLHSFFNLYGETFIIYNPDYQTLKINKSITTMADGTVVETPENAFNESLPHVAAKAPAYSHLREMVVTHTGLEIGAVVELDYTITSKPGFFPSFDNMVIFREEDPVKEYEVVVKVPESTTLHHSISATIGSVKPANENGQNIYTWNLKNIQGASKDAFDPLAVLNSVALVFSSEGNYQQLFAEITKQPAFEQETLPEPALEITDEILKDNRLEIMQILEIQKYVINNINTNKIPDQLLGYHFATPTEVWQRNYGTEAEKATLMALMLKNAGFTAYPTTVTNEKLFSLGIPSLAIYDQWIVKTLLADGKPLYLSPTYFTKVNMKYDYLENSIAFPINLNVDIMRPDMFTSIMPINQLSGTMTLDADNQLSGNLDVKIEASMNPYLEIEKNVNQLKNLLSGISEKSFADSKKPKIAESQTEATLTFSQPDFCQIKGDYYFLTIPELKPSVEATNLGALPTSRSSYFQVKTQRTVSNIKLTIPENLTLVTPVSLLKESRKSFGYYKIEISSVDNTININRQIEISESMILPIHYAAMRTFLLEWNDAAFKQLIFKKK